MVPRNAGRHDGERPFGTSRPNSHRLEFKSMWSQAQRYLFRQTAVALAVAGSGVAVLLWLVFSAGFGLYVANFGSYNQTYGAVAGVIIFLIWLWLSNLAILFGVELDAELARGRAIAAGHPPAREPYAEPRDTRKFPDESG